MPTQIFALKIGEMPKEPAWETLGEFEPGKYNVSAEAQFAWDDPLAANIDRGVGLAIDLDGFTSEGKFVDRWDSQVYLRVDEMYKTESSKLYSRMVSKTQQIDIPFKMNLAVMKLDQSPIVEGSKGKILQISSLTITIEGPL